MATVMRKAVEKMAGMSVRSVIGAFREYLQLQGYRGFDLERASSGDISDDQGPEQLLNICLVCEVFVQILATGVGTIAFIWATVVLLGGFSTYLHKVDFWVVTGIVFVQAAKLVGVNSNTEAKYFAQVPPAFLELGVKLFIRRRPLKGEVSGRNLWNSIIFSAAATSTDVAVNAATDVIFLMGLLTLVLLLLPMFAASSCIGLSIFRLHTITRHKQYRDSGADGSKANVLRALIFFYALVLAQGGLFLIWLFILSYRSEMKEKVCSKYHLEGKDMKLMDKYIDRTSSTCIKTGVIKTINRKLVSFAIDLLHSEYIEDRNSGVQLLHRLTTDAKKKKHIDRAIADIQSSPDCIARMLVLLSSKSGIDENRKVNLALIVTKISKGLRLSDVDGAMESLSSLIDPYKISAQNGENNRPLIIHGLEILAKLAQKNPDNCTKIFSTKDLFRKIIAPISNKLYTVAVFTDDESGNIAVEITEKSLRVVSKLVEGTHHINRKICRKICGTPDSQKKKNICGTPLLVDIIHQILKLEQERYNNLKVAAIKILSHLELVNIDGDDADAKVNYIIHRLMGLLFDESISIKKAAAKALVLLASDSRTTHCTTIMNWRRRASGSSDVVQQLPDVVQQLSDVVRQLSRVLPDDDSPPSRSPDPSYQNAVAQLLTQFCVHTTDAKTRELLKSILHKVLDVIILEVDEALGSENQQLNSRRQNRRPFEFILNFCPPCVDTSSCASRQGASQHVVGDNGGNTLQNHTVAGSQNPSNLNRLVNMPGAYSNVPGDQVKAKLDSTPIEAGSRKTLVAFLGLALQICDKLSDADDFNEAVTKSTCLSHGADLVDRFEKIIARCNKEEVGLLKGRGPLVDYLMMIRSATKLCAWIMRGNKSYVRYFQQKNIDQKLEKAFEALRGLDVGVLLTCSADQLRNYETLSSIVKDATKHIIQSRPTTPPPPSVAATDSSVLL